VEEPDPGELGGGVGTKLRLRSNWACTTRWERTCEHCVKRYRVQGATPLFFLDYLASGRLDPEVTESV